MTRPTTVVNIHHKVPYDVYIGRPGKGQDGFWGNPFSSGTREENVAAFAEWIVTKPKKLERLHELRGKRLGCFCKPKLCHGDVLAQLADQLKFDVGDHVEAGEFWRMAKVVEVLWEPDIFGAYRPSYRVREFEHPHDIYWVEGNHIGTPQGIRHDERRSNTSRTVF